MINFIEQLISDTHHGSTVLFRQTLEYFLGLSDDQLQNQIKLSTPCKSFSIHGIIPKFKYKSTKDSIL